MSSIFGESVNVLSWLLYSATSTFSALFVHLGPVRTDDDVALEKIYHSNKFIADVAPGVTEKDAYEVECSRAESSESVGLTFVTCSGRRMFSPTIGRGKKNRSG